jgi:excisionase family DNA binding protein
MPNDKSAFLTVTELAELLRVGRTTAYALVKTGEIPSVRVGGQLRIPRRTLARQLAKHMVGLDDGGDPV